MRSHSGVAARVFETLAQIGVNIDMISTSEIKISVVINMERGEEAMRAVHAAFLEQGAVVYTGRSPVSSALGRPRITEATNASRMVCRFRTRLTAPRAGAGRLLSGFGRTSS